MEDFEEALSKIGYGISVIVGNIAEFFLGPLPKFLLRLGVPYLMLLGISLCAAFIFRIAGFITMVNPISIIIAMGIVAILMVMSISLRKGGQKYDTNE